MKFGEYLWELFSVFGHGNELSQDAKFYSSLGLAEGLINRR